MAVMPPPGPPAGAPEGAAAPPAAPPEAIQQAGEYARARVQVLKAHKLLQEAIGKMPQGSEEEQAVLGALKSLADWDTGVSPGLLATEAMALGGGAQGAPGMGPGGGGGAPMGGPGPMPI